MRHAVRVEQPGRISTSGSFGRLTRPEARPQRGFRRGELNFLGCRRRQGLRCPGEGAGSSRWAHESLEGEFGFGGGGGDPAGDLVGVLGIAVAQTLPESWYLVPAAAGGLEWAHST